MATKLTIPDHIVKEAKADEYPPLEQAARERLYTLLSDAADMGIALNCLLATKTPLDCGAAWPELHHALDSRLAKAMNILTGGSEDD